MGQPGESTHTTVAERAQTQAELLGQGIQAIHFVEHLLIEKPHEAWQLGLADFMDTRYDQAPSELAGSLSRAAEEISIHAEQAAGLARNQASLAAKAIARAAGDRTRESDQRV